MSNSFVLPIADARPGLRLGLDLRDANGAVLLAAGSELTEPLIAALSRRGVETITVVQANDLTPEEMAARREAARLHLAHLFRRSVGREADRQLFEILLDYRMEQIG